MATPTKTCRDCGTTKPTADFSPSGAGGLRSYCKACASDRSRRWRQANRDKVRAQKRRSWNKHKDRLNAQRREKRGNHERELARAWRLKHPEQYRARVRAYRQANTERVAEWHRRWYAVHGLEWTRQWRAENPERVREHNHRRRAAVRNPSPETMDRVAVLLDESCAYCGSRDGIEIDHVVPLSRGGAHEPDNLVAACQSCNRSKHNKLVEEWMGVN